MNERLPDGRRRSASEVKQMQRWLLDQAGLIALLRSQFARRHPEWFDLAYYRPLTQQERRKRRLAGEEERMERVMKLAGKKS